MDLSNLLGIKKEKLIEILNDRSYQFQEIEENDILISKKIIINKKDYNYNGKLFPPKVQCPKQFTKCPCLNYE